MKLLSLLALSLAYLLKRHYSTASAEALRWVLDPTSYLTSLLLGREFHFRAQEGYLSRELSILISPACAGVNFLIIAFVTLVLGFGARFKSSATRLGFLIAAAGIAYATTVVVNALRIAVSVAVAHLAAGALGFTFQAIHRAVGVGVYLGGLLLLCLAMQRWLGSRAGAQSRRGVLLLALGCYLTVVLFVPWLRGGAAAPGFWSHAALVSGVVLAIGALLFAVGGRTWDDGRHEFGPSELPQRVPPQQSTAG